jgi:hypothetical protein
MVECGVATWYEYLGLCIAPCSSLSSEWTCSLINTSIWPMHNSYRKLNILKLNVIWIFTPISSTLKCIDKHWNKNVLWQHFE